MWEQLTSSSDLSASILFSLVFFYYAGKCQINIAPQSIKHLTAEYKSFSFCFLVIFPLLRTGKINIKHILFLFNEDTDFSLNYWEFKIYFGKLIFPKNFIDTY